jgi:hypothetical protein
MFFRSYGLLNLLTRLLAFFPSRYMPRPFQKTRSQRSLLLHNPPKPLFLDQRDLHMANEMDGVQVLLMTLVRLRRILCPLDADPNCLQVMEDHIQNAMSHSIH